MQTITVQDRQTLFDIAIQHCGDREAVFQIAEMNNISFSEALSVGFSLQIPEPVNQRVVDFYTNNSIFPATATAEQEDIPENAITTNDGQYLLNTNNNNLFIINNNHV